MKQLTNLRRKSTLLLFTLVALFAGGVSPAWGDAYTCGFDTSEGWTSKNDNLSTVGENWTYTAGALSYYNVSSTYGVSGQGLVCTGGNTDYYIFTPKVKAGLISLSAKRTTNSTSSSYRSYVYIYKCTYNEGTKVYTPAGTASLNYNSNGDLVQSKFTSTSFILDEDSYLAIRLIRAGIDNFTAANGLADEGAIAKPTDFTSTSTTYNSATLSWTAGGTETNWLLAFDTDTDFDKDRVSPAPTDIAAGDLSDGKYTLTGLSESTTYYAYLRAKDGEDVSAWTSKISFTTPAQYLAPTGLAASDETTTTATVSWTAGSDETAWEVSYSVNSDFSSSTEVTADDTSKGLTGLTANTTYYVRVRADYGSSHYSAWTDAITFTTKVEPISTYPYTEDFNGLTSANEIPAFWNNDEGTATNASYKWCYNTSTSGNGATNGTSHDGSKCIRFDSYNNSNGVTNFLKTRPFSWASGKAMKLTFWYKNPKGGDFSVYASTDGGATYPTALATGLTNASDWTEKDITIPASVYGNNVVIVFKGTSNWGSGDAYIYLDDVEISEVNDYSLAISGSDVSENTIAFGTVKNTTTTKTFTITNDGGEDLTGISVVSSDATVFTVSDTGFDLASGATKDITVTFVKGVEKDGGYNATITVSQANIATPLSLTVTGTYVAPTPATIAVKLGGSAVGASVTYGTVGKAKSKTFTVENTGEATLNITSIVSSNTTDFTVSPATLNVAGGETGEFTVTFAWDGEALNAEKTANITVTPSNAGLDPVVFAVTGTRADMWSEDFSGNVLPDGWEITNSTYWKVEDNMLKGSYSYDNYDLITPSLVVEEGQSMTFDYRMTSTYRSLDIQYSKDNGAWTNLSTISYSGLTLNQWYTYTIENLDAGKYKFRFGDSNYDLKNFEGFKLNFNDPQLGVYATFDGESTYSNAVTSGTTKYLTWSQDAQWFTYYIKNDNTGTLTINEVTNSNETDFTTTVVNESNKNIAAGAALAFTVTMNAASVGEKTATITLSTNVGDFEIPVKGFVYGDRNLVDFTDATQYQGWTGVSVTDNAAKLSSTAIETTPFAATAGEKLYVEIKGSSSWGSKSFSYSYYRDGAWSEATALIASTNNSVADQIFVIEDIADAEAEKTVQIRFTGAGLSINRIYGFEALQVPVMTLDKTAESYNFNMQTANEDYVITVTNTGTATLNNLAASLERGTNYIVAITKPEGESTTTISEGKATVPAGQQAVITVTQVFDADNGLASLSDVLTISADDVASQVINLSGKTRDGSKLYVDFASGIPSSFVEKGSWSYSSQQAYVYNESALVSQTLTIAANEKVQFDAKQMTYGTPSLKVRHSLNGGLSWSDYTDFTDTEGFNSSAYKTMQYSVGNTDASAVAMIEFLGANVYLDNIYGGTLNNDAPMIQVKKYVSSYNQPVVASGVTHEFGSISTATDATYTITNIGNGTLTITDPVAATGGATTSISATSLTNGQSATLTITMTPAEPYGEKSGAVTVETNLGNFVINYTATTLNPNALDFSDGNFPAGWYNGGWSTYSGYIYRNYPNNNPAEFVSQKLTVAGTDDKLTFDAEKYNTQYASNTVLEVYYSTDRANWTLIKDYAEDMTTSWQTFEIKGLEAGDYYLKFNGRYAELDNIKGWTKAAAPVHDLYVATFTTPSTTKDAGDEVTISATVASLIDAQDGVYAKLFVDGEQVGDASTVQNIALNGTQTFSFDYTMPAAGTHTAQIKVYYSDGTEAFTTAEKDMKVYYVFDETVASTFTAGISDVKLTYTKGAGSLGTICLPFATTTEVLSELYGTTVKVYEMSAFANNVITFTGVDELMAGKPYLIYSEEAMSGTKTFADKAVTAATAGKTEASSVTFYGIYAPVTAGNWDEGWYGVTSEGKIAPGTSTTTMKALRGYFTGAVANARIFIMDDEFITGIGNISGKMADVDGDIYDLQGRKVVRGTLSNGTLPSGLYIINGKKVFVK